MHKRPLLASQYPENHGKLRLIGLELRLTSPEGMREELEMIALEWELLGTCNAAYAWEFGPHTLHTSIGDVAIPSVRLPASGFGLPPAQPPQRDIRRVW